MSQTSTSADAWISQARFDRDHGTAGIDHDFGMLWGEHQRERVSLRLPPGTQHGVLYAFDPLWNEYLILDDSATRTEAIAAFGAVVAEHGYRGAPVSAFADAVRQRRLAPLLAASLEPHTLDALGIES